MNGTALLVGLAVNLGLLRLTEGLETRARIAIILTSTAYHLCGYVEGLSRGAQ